jgi:hypothetical protein
LLDLQIARESSEAKTRICCARAGQAHHPVSGFEGNGKPDLGQENIAHCAFGLVQLAKARGCLRHRGVPSVRATPRPTGLPLSLQIEMGIENLRHPMNKGVFDAFQRQVGRIAYEKRTERVGSPSILHGGFTRRDICVKKGENRPILGISRHQVKAVTETQVDEGPPTLGA